MDYYYILIEDDYNGFFEIKFVTVSKERFLKFCETFKTEINAKIEVWRSDETEAFFSCDFYKYDLIKNL